jgi:deoxyribonuclease V
MKFKKLHPWNVDKHEAIHIQHELSKLIILKNSFRQVKRIAGCDVAYSAINNKACAAICLFCFPAMNKINEVTCVSEVIFPYVSGLLAFREGPALLQAFKKLTEKPDIMIFNGQGIAHPRKMGLATHMGIILDIPSIGCTQRSMFRKYDNPGNHSGAFSEICDDKNNIVGACLRTKDKTNPVFISQGYKIELQTAIDIILQCTLGYKMPEPLRVAHILANSLKEK